MTIVDGEHRWRACKALGYLELPIVKTEMSLEQMRIATLRHNRARGSEDAGLAAEVLKELISLGTMDWAKDALMLDDVEVRRLTESLRAEDVDSLVSDAEVTPEMLGAGGGGVSEFDETHGVNTDADRTRAKERLVAARRAGEEKTMAADDRSVYRLVLSYTGREAEIVREAVGPNAPEAVLAMCAAEQATTA